MGIFLGSRKIFELFLKESSFLLAFSFLYEEEKTSKKYQKIYQEGKSSDSAGGFRSSKTKRGDRKTLSEIFERKLTERKVFG